MLVLDSRMRAGRLRAVLPADPGRARLIKAVTAAVSVGVGLGTMWALSPFLVDGAHMVVVAGFLALQSMLMVRDRTLPQRRTTTALLILPGIGAGALNAAVHGSAYGGDVMFVVVATAAVWVRRYGARAGAVGMIGFFGYFFAQLLDVDAQRLPAFVTAVVCGLGGTALVRSLVVPERPGRRLERMRRDLAKASLMMIDTAWSSPRSAWDGARWRRNVDRLSACVGAIEEWQADHSTERFVDVDEEALARLLFALQMSVEELSEELWALPDGTTADPALGGAVGRIRAVLRRRADDDADSPVVQHRIGAAAKAGAVAADQRAAVRAAGRAEKAVRSLAAVSRRRRPLRQRRYGTAGAVRGIDHARGKRRRVGPAGGGRPRWDAGARATVQTAVATTVATVVGHMISADRWYWAVLTAFMIFYNTTSRGEILVRARHRMAGTVIGVVAALALVTLIGHHRPIEYIALVVCVFAVVYFGPLSYTALTFFITLLLAWMYELMGIFDLRILEWRVEETLAGAIIGIGAAFLITPTHTTPIAVARMETVFARIDDVMDGAVRTAAGGEAGDLSESVHAFDAARASAASAAGTLLGGLVPRRIRTGRRLQRDLRALGWSVHAVARTAAAVPISENGSCELDLAEARRWAVRVHVAAEDYQRALEQETGTGPRRRAGAKPECGDRGLGGGTAPKDHVGASPAVSGCVGVDETVRALRRLERCLQ